MAIEKAKELLKKLNENEELMAAFKANPEAVLAAGDYGCTLAEFKEASMLNRELDDQELEAISGGSAKGPGGCQTNWYKDPCASTVETGSWCGSNDYCMVFDVAYIHYYKTECTYATDIIG